MKAPLFSKEGHKKKEMILNLEVFGARVNRRLLELVTVAYGRNKRRGTAKTKERSEVRGGGKKPWRQKGTGRARHASIRSPIWRGGGTVFGPRVRSYYVSLPSSMRRSALICALSLRAREKKLGILEDIRLETAKTRELVQMVRALKMQEKKTLCVVKEIGENLKRASRNVQGMIKFLTFSDLNAYHILQREELMIELDALELIEKRLTQSEPAGAKKTGAAAVEPGEQGS